MHDSSRDLVLAGTQQSAELKLALDQVSKVGHLGEWGPSMRTVYEIDSKDDHIH